MLTLNIYVYILYILFIIIIILLLCYYYYYYVEVCDTSCDCKWNNVVRSVFKD